MKHYILIPHVIDIHELIGDVARVLKIKKKICHQRSKKKNVGKNLFSW